MIIISHGEASGSFPRKRVGKPPGRFRIGQGLAKRIMNPTEIDFAGRVLSMIYAAGS